MHTFVINGYGIPDDLTKDQNYLTYLHVTFNTIFEQARGQEAVLIPSGGPTACTPPYEGTEAHVIAEYLRKLMQRDVMLGQTAKWRIIEEDESLSSLENLLYTKAIIDREQLPEPVTIFCDKTREERIQTIADKVFDHAIIVGVDFDISKNRYIERDIISKKEKLATAESLWTLQDPAHLEPHHDFFAQKLEFLRERQRQGLSHVDAVNEWFTKMPEVMKHIMPADHPFLKSL